MASSPRRNYDEQAIEPSDPPPGRRNSTSNWLGQRWRSLTFRLLTVSIALSTDTVTYSRARGTFPRGHLVTNHRSGGESTALASPLVCADRGRATREWDLPGAGH